MVTLVFRPEFRCPSLGSGSGSGCRLVSYTLVGLFFAARARKRSIRRDRGGELSLHSPAWSEATSPSGTPTAVAPPSPPAAPVVTPSSSSSKLAAFVAAVPQPKGPSAETAPRPTSRLAELIAAVPSR